MKSFFKIRKILCHVKIILFEVENVVNETYFIIRVICNEKQNTELSFLIRGSFHLKRFFFIQVKNCQEKDKYLFINRSYVPNKKNMKEKKIPSLCHQLTLTRNTDYQNTKWLPPLHKGIWQGYVTSTLERPPDL